MPTPEFRGRIGAPHKSFGPVGIRLRQIPRLPRWPICRAAARVHPTWSSIHMKTIDIKGNKETIIERSDYPIEKQKQILGKEVTAILGYGPQGRGQGLNMRDQGFNVLLGLRKGRSWDLALEDGWEEGKNLFEIEDAARKGTIIQYLISDAAQISNWPAVKACLKEGDCPRLLPWLRDCVPGSDYTVPPKYVDVVLVPRRRSYERGRKLFEAGSGTNSSFAIYQDYTKNGRGFAAWRHRVRDRVRPRLRNDVRERSVQAPDGRAVRADGAD